MSVAPPQPAPSAHPASAPADFIDDDFFTAWCQTRLLSMDSQIRSFMDGQKALQDKQNQLNELKNMFNNAAGHAPKDGYDKGSAEGLKAYQDLANQIEEYEKAHNLSPDVKDQFDQAKASVQSWYPPKKDDQGNVVRDDDKKVVYDNQYVNADNIKALGEGLQSSIDSYQNEASMDMLRMNSCVSKREQAVQLTSNMLKKLDDTVSAAIANIR